MDRAQGFPGGTVVKNPPAKMQDMRETQVRSYDWDHSSVLAWRIPKTEEPGGL